MLRVLGAKVIRANYSLYIPVILETAALLAAPTRPNHIVNLCS
jgi:hypothetical protein